MTHSAARTLALTACLTVGIHSASANDYPPPPGPYNSEPGGATGLSPSLGVGTQSAAAISALPEDTARVRSTGSSGRETTRAPIDKVSPSGPTPSGGVTGRFRPAAATEYSQPAVVPRPAATPLSPDGRIYPANPEDRREAASGDTRVGNGRSDLRTDQSRSSVNDGRAAARHTPQTPVFRPPEATGR